MYQERFMVLWPNASPVAILWHDFADRNCNDYRFETKNTSMSAEITKGQNRSDAKVSLGQALLASYEKDEVLLRLARLLVEHGWSLLGSEGTARYLNENNIVCRDVSEIVGTPILGHRVVTLSREIHAALLSTPKDADELEKLGITPIDLVYVTLYPLERTVADPSATPDDVLEKTDIGGPTLLRSAAKGRRLALSDPSQVDALERWFSRGASGEEREKLVRRFAAAAERRVADYVGISASYWEKRSD